MGFGGLSSRNHFNDWSLVEYCDLFGIEGIKSRMSEIVLHIDIGKVLADPPAKYISNNSP